MCGCHNVDCMFFGDGNVVVEIVVVASVSVLVSVSGSCVCFGVCW